MDICSAYGWGAMISISPSPQSNGEFNAAIVPIVVWGQENGQIVGYVPGNYDDSRFSGSALVPVSQVFGFVKYMRISEEGD